MIFFTTTRSDDELTDDPSEVEELGTGLDDAVLDEVAGVDDVADDTEGFGIVDEEVTSEDDPDIEEEEEEDLLEEELEPEEDADDTEYDSFDDIDEL